MGFQISGRDVAAFAGTAGAGDLGDVVISADQASYSGVKRCRTWTLNASKTCTLQDDKPLIIIATDAIVVNGTITSKGKCTTSSNRMAIGSNAGSGSGGGGGGGNSGGNLGTDGAVGAVDTSKVAWGFASPTSGAIGALGAKGAPGAAGGNGTAGAAGAVDVWLAVSIEAHGAGAAQYVGGYPGVGGKTGGTGGNGGDAGGGAAAGGGGGAGGAGGNGGGVIILIAPKITLAATATIDCSGNNGGAGVVGTVGTAGTVPNGGGGGGGGGGSGGGGGAGGILILAYGAKFDAGATLTVAGGSGGAAANGGGGGAPDGTGTAGGAGGQGAAGHAGPSGVSLSLRVFA